MLQKLLTVDYNKCRAYQPLNRTNTSNLDLCDLVYSYSRYSLVQQIYDYLAITNDLNFLNETASGKTILQWLENLTLFYESGNEGKLVDFGNDYQLYEFNIHCPVEKGLSGKYTGYVVSPNSERYHVMNLMGEIYEKINNPTKATEFKNRAQAIKTAINTLWNPNAQWFDTISLYNPDLSLRQSPYRNTFHNVAIFHTLDAPGLLSSEQIQGILNHLPLFINQTTKRFTSLPTQGYNWCSRIDWHGPGLYVGEIGQMLTRMFDYGLKEEAAKILFTPGQGYYFTADIPFFQQAYRDSTEWQDDQTGQYYEGVALAQALIRGLAGIEPNLTEGIKFHPRLPNASIYPLIYNNIKLRGFTFNFTAESPNKTKYVFTNTNNQSSFGFEYTPDDKGHDLIIQLKNQPPNTYFKFIATPTNGAQTITYGKSDNQGAVQFSLFISTTTKINISQTASPPCFTCPTDLPPNSWGNANCDGKINSVDFGLWLKVFQKPNATQEEKQVVNFNCQENQAEPVVDLEDFKVWARNY